MEAKPVWRLDWSESLSMRIPEIDAEHRHFIGLVNELNEAIIERMDNKEIQRRMRAVLDDATMHFAHEEALLKEWGYPEAEEHAQQHAQISAFLNEIMKSVDRGRIEHGWLEAGLEMKRVLVKHLLNDDMKYRDYHLAQSQQSHPKP